MTTGFLPLEDTELGGLLADLDPLREDFPGIGTICDGLRALHQQLTRPADNQAAAEERLGETKTALTAIANNGDRTDLLAALGEFVANVTSPDVNPNLSTLPEGQQKDARFHGETTAHRLADDYPRDSTADAIAALHAPR